MQLFRAGFFGLISYFTYRDPDKWQQTHANELCKEMFEVAAQLSTLLCSFSYDWLLTPEYITLLLFKRETVYMFSFIW